MIELRQNGIQFIINSAIIIIIFVNVVQIDTRAVAYNAYSRPGNVSRQSSPYTIAIFKDQQAAPLHTIAVIKPFVNQTNSQDNPLFYKPFIQPDAFSLVDQEENHEGEVFENEISQQDTNANQYYTIDVNQELFGASPSDPDSYFPPYQESDSTDSNFTGYPAAIPAVKNFTGYPNAAYTTPYPVLLTTEFLDLALPVEQNNTQIVLAKDKLYSLFYIGYKFWYGMLLFVVYHVTMVIVFYLSKLAKHYTRFPAAFQAVAASDWTKPALEGNVNMEYYLFGIKPSLTLLVELFTYLFWTEEQRKTNFISYGSFVKRLKNDKLKWLDEINFTSLENYQSKGRGVITQAIWNIPLYFNVYFIVYMSYLILKSIAGHKIKLPHIGH